MQFITNLLSKIGYFLFFLFLEVVALFFMYKQSDFHKNAIGVKATAANGYYSERVSYIKHYFNLPEENTKIMAENARLKNELENLRALEDDSTQLTTKIDSLHMQKYSYISAKIIDPSLRKRDNYFLLNKGKKDGIKTDMAVITPRGIIGVVLNVSDHYASVISILHSQTRIKARMKNMEHFGILTWPGEDHRYFELHEIPKYLEVNKGDTIITAGASALYPEGIEIGQIMALSPNETTGDFDIQVKLFEDLGDVRNVYVVENLDQLEIQQVMQVEPEINNTVNGNPQ